jgi:predicted nucleic acid-binding protein
MDLALLDTDTLNEVLKQRNSEVIRHSADYLQQHGQFALSSMSRYELLRGPSVNATGGHSPHR